MNNAMRYIRRSRVSFIVGILMMNLTLSAQTPTHYPTGQSKVDFNFVNILIYIVFPVLLVLIWILIRRRKAGKDKE